MPCNFLLVTDGLSKVAEKLLEGTLSEVGLTRKDVIIVDMRKGEFAEYGITELPRDTFIITMGEVASEAVLETKKHSVSTCVFSAKHLAWIFPTYHFTAVIANPDKPQFFDAILDTFRQVASYVRGELQAPVHDDEFSWFYVTASGQLAQQKEKHIGEGRYETSQALTWSTDLTALKVLQWIALSPQITLDLETDNTRFLTDPLLLVALSNGSGVHLVIEASVLLQSESLLREQLMNMFCSPDIEWVIHNAAFDLQFLQHHFVCQPLRVLDTMAMALSVNEQSQSVGLKKLARKWFGASDYEAGIKPFVAKSKDAAGRVHYGDVPRLLLAQYAAMDVYYTSRLPAILWPLVRSEGTEKVLRDILIPAQRMFAEVHMNGVKIDLEQAQRLQELWGPRLEAAVEELADYAESVGFDARNVVKAKKASSRLNPNSSVQLKHLFYDVLHYAPIAESGRGKMIKTGRTTAGNFIVDNAGDKPIELLRTIRSLTRMLKTYVVGIVDDVWPDGRAHPEFRLAAAVTGRISVTNPALQTIPHWSTSRTGLKNTEDMAGQIRRMFVATEGYVLCEADYSQLELRVAWHYSGDEAFGASLMSGDFHAATASRVFNKPLSEVTKEDRLAVKVVTFGLMYGRQASTLAHGELKTSVAVAQGYIDAFWSAYPKYRLWWERIKKEVVVDGYVQSTLGRRRRWSLITRANYNDVCNQAVNMPIQSLASDLCLTSAIRVHNNLKETGWGRVLFLVHDSIVTELKEEYVTEATNMISREMSTPTFETCARFDVDISIGPNWNEIKTLH